MSSYSSTIMKDQRVVAEEAQVVAAPESVLTFTQAYPGSVAVAGTSSVGDILFQEYTPEVRKTMGDLIESVELVHTETIPTVVESFNLTAQGLFESLSETTQGLTETFSEAIGKTAETGRKVTEVLGEKLTETQQGVSSILPGMAAYLLIAVVAIVVVGKVWK